jgi:hypothetical protein
MKRIFTTIALAAAATAQELPRAYVNTKMPPLAGRSLLVQPNCSDLQQKLNEAQLGDEIVIPAGVECRGNYRLPKKPSAGWLRSWITIRGDRLSELPEGKRVTPEQSHLMPKIMNARGGMAAIQTDAGAWGYRIAGIEVADNPAAAAYWALIHLDGGKNPPRDIILDRMYIHGTPTANLRRGVSMNCANCAVIDSHISEVHEIGADSQAICGWAGPGPIKISNNYLAGSGENIMFGGAMPSIPGLIPSDIEITGNHLDKPLSWRKGDPSFSGKLWTVKNLFELKSAQRVLFENNLLTRNWLQAQTGTALLFQGQPGQSGAWSFVADVTVRNNVIRHATGVLTICGRCIYSPAQTADPTAPWYVDPSIPNVRNVTFENNVTEDIVGRKWGNSYARMFQFSGGPENVVIRKNTFSAHDGVVLLFDNGARPMAGFVFRDNAAPWGEHGINWGNGSFSGYDFAAPGAVIEGNAFLCVPGGFTRYVPQILPIGRFPANSFFYAGAAGCG